MSSFELSYINNEDELLDSITKTLIDGKVIGFFHGSFEWGPRALGNRSIIVGPRIKNMKDVNKKIKKRESFRPFAPSILREKVDEWFEKNRKVPFMTHVFNIKEEKENSFLLRLAKDMAQVVCNQLPKISINDIMSS